MIELNQEKAKLFLAKNNLQNCEIKKIAGDASLRSYYRIFAAEKIFILMFAPPGYEDIHPFIKIDKFLCDNNFSAPKIFAVDEENGFILLEDFGDDSYGRILAKNSDQNLENNLYKNAVDALLELHKVAPPKDIDIHNNAILYRGVTQFFEWYLPKIKKIEMTLDEKKQFNHLWFDLFDLLNKENQVVVLRDYHADNLMLVKNREGFKSVGLLDFQDAAIGSNAYDLVSLLEDARRDVSKNCQKKMYEHYISCAKNNNKNFSEEKFHTDYEILSLQRNIRILGIFARLAHRDSKMSYLNLLPRVKDYVMVRLETKSHNLNAISNFLKKFI